MIAFCHPVAGLVTIGVLGACILVHVAVRKMNGGKVGKSVLITSMGVGGYLCLDVAMKAATAVSAKSAAVLAAMLTAPLWLKLAVFGGGGLALGYATRNLFVAAYDKWAHWREK